jgi:hypothetical protein
MKNAYAWEDKEYTKKLRKMKKDPSKKRMRFVVFPLVLSAVCYGVLLARKPVLQVLFTFVSGGLVEKQLRIEYYSYVLYLAMLLLPVVGCAVYFIYKVLSEMIRGKAEFIKKSDSTDPEERRRTYLEQYKNYTEKKSSHWKNHAFFYVLFAIQLALMTQGFFFSSVPGEMAAFYGDVKLLRSGDIPVYDGELLPTDRPADNDNGYIFTPEKDYYYFSSDVGTLRCLKKNLETEELTQPSYSVEYLPGTYTIVSITNDDGIVLTGTDWQDDTDTVGAVNEQGYWQYGDLAVRSCTEVYGYDKLSEAGQRAFDLMYGEYYSKDLAPGGIHDFYLSEAIPKNEYNRVLELYLAATARYGIDGREWRYDTNDTGTVRKVYAARVVHSEEGQSTWLSEAQAKAAEIVAGMPVNLTDTEKCAYLVKYLAEHTEYYEGEMPQTHFKDSSGADIYVSAPTPDFDTSYGALVKGQANSAGYAAAFGELAYQAGIDCIYVLGETTERTEAASNPQEQKAWNMVQIDGAWYNIDVAWIDNGSSMDMKYFMASDSGISDTHKPDSYGGCSFVPLPKAVTDGD